ncbi:cell division control protein 6 homolog [Oppia nitens]|uniref:cell division control protein 6 homolog n=1 Tax=Oppia nitens TaxID=1686743 RepID=UPI0023DBEAFE|nr:cell division control protein 6 homolog [Oppia nitens]
MTKCLILIKYLLKTLFRSTMSSTIQTEINFSVRKSGRKTKKVNYNEKEITKCMINETIETKTAKTPKSKTPAKTKTKITAKRLSNCDTIDNKVDENKESLAVSPTKVKKTLHESQPISVLSKTKQFLSPSVVDSVIGRDNECTRVRQLVTSHLTSKQAVSVYISGSAGTGKTLSVTYVLDQLKQTFNFNLITINCMTFRNANAIYNKILNELKQKRHLKQSDCLQAINVLLTGRSSDEMVVLVLDEIDQLLDSKGHDVLNTIFLWTKLTKSRLILIGIANSLDFTSRVLSRIKAIGVNNIEELHFKPYSTQQIVAVIENRIQRASDQQNVVITPLAIQLCARKIGTVSGDIRKALDVCRRALELVQNTDKPVINSNNPLKLSNDDGFNSGSPKKTVQHNGTNCVDVPQIMAVLNRVYGQKFETESKHKLPFNQQIILCSLLVIFKHKSIKEVKLSECHHIFGNICAKRGINSDIKSEGQLLSMCQLLEDYGLVAIKSSCGQSVRNAKISLKVDETEIRQVLSDTQFLNAILNQSTNFIS